MIDDTVIKGFITALGIGLMIGVVRERRHAPESAEAGIRTHALVSILGATSWSLGIIPFTATLITIGAFAVTSYLRTSHKDPGLTGEVTIILTFVLSAMALEKMAVATGLGVLCALLIQAKSSIHRLSRELITESEVNDGLLILASALIVMPLLPDNPIDPWGVLKPTAIWRIVVLVMATGMLGHVARRALGHKRGFPIAGFFSGFVSSTAAIASFGDRSKEHHQLTPSAAAAALLSNLASYLLFIGVIVTVSPVLVESMIPSFALGGISLFLVAMMLLVKHHSQEDIKTPPAGQTFKLSHAFFIAFIISGVSLLSAWLNEIFGGMGVLVTSVVVALAEIHAAAAGLGQLTSSGALSVEMGRWGILAVLVASSLAKIVLAAFSGGKRYALLISTGLTAMIIGTLIGLIIKL